jgi:hypothetical protein
MLWALIGAAKMTAYFFFAYLFAPINEFSVQSDYWANGYIPNFSIYMTIAMLLLIAIWVIYGVWIALKMAIEKKQQNRKLL